MKTNVHFWLYLAHFFLEWEMFRIKVVEKIETHILCSITFHFIVPFMQNCGKILYVELATDDSMAHAHCMLDT